MYDPAVTVNARCTGTEASESTKLAAEAGSSCMPRSGLLPQSFLSMPNSDCHVWRRLDEQGENPFWGELEHYHNFGRRRLYQLLESQGFEPIRYGVSERYYMCMEVIAKKR